MSATNSRARAFGTQAMGPYARDVTAAIDEGRALVVWCMAGPCGQTETVGRPRCATCGSTDVQILGYEVGAVSRAADRLAAMDFDETDGMSMDELGVDWWWPEPGEPCMNTGLSIQLYWPALGPGGGR